jgi:hypothetical protein
VKKDKHTGHRENFMIISGTIYNATAKRIISGKGN